MSRFYLEAYAKDSRLPDGVALSAFVKTSGDTVGIVHIQETGGFVLMRNGSCVGTFDTLAAMYRKLDTINEAEL